MSRRANHCKNIDQMVSNHGAVRVSTGRVGINVIESRCNEIIMSDKEEQFHDQPLTEHLRELRSCLIYSLVAVFAGFGLAYTVIRPIGSWFFKPLVAVLPEGTNLIFTSYQEGFFFT